MNFIVYHSGFDTERRGEGRTARTRRRGIDSLVRSLEENGVKPGSNVYAELGSTWRFLMRDPSRPRTALGKLLRAVGEDNVLWGTDSIWYGSPRTRSRPSAPSRSRRSCASEHGYPEITPRSVRRCSA